MKEKISIISTFAEDRILYLDTGRRKTTKGGPAFWITKTLKDLGASYSLISPRKMAITEILAKDGEETGSLVFVPKIKLDRNLSGNFIISTLADEFKLENISRLNGFIVLDIQGYARVAKRQVKVPRGIASRISILKTTLGELSKIGKKLINDQKKRMLIVTKGKKGFDVYHEGKKSSFLASIVKTKDTLGAGDAFLASFVVEYLKSESHLKAAKFAKRYVEKFLRKEK